MFIKGTFIAIVIFFLNACGMTAEQVVYEISGDTGEDDQLYQRLSDLRFDIEMLTQQGLCSNDMECQTVGVGVKPCGGYRHFFAYSNTTSDLTAIMSLVKEYNFSDNKLDHRIERVDKCIIGVDPGASCRTQRCTLSYVP